MPQVIIAVVVVVAIVTATAAIYKIYYIWGSQSLGIGSHNYITYSCGCGCGILRNYGSHIHDGCHIHSTHSCIRNSHGHHNSGNHIYVEAITLVTIVVLAIEVINIALVAKPFGILAIAVVA